MKAVKRIAIVGPESTGKSMLAHALQSKLDAVVVEEAARSYLEKLGRPYRESDLLEIAKLQCETEDKALKTGKDFILCDTNLLVIKIWSLHSYSQVDPWIEEELNRRKYDLHLLCNIDMPWESDPLREHPHLRSFFINWYHRELIEMNVNYEFVTGLEEQRTENALTAIKKMNHIGT